MAPRGDFLRVYRAADIFTFLKDRRMMRVAGFPRPRPDGNRTLFGDARRLLSFLVQSFAGEWSLRQSSHVVFFDQAFFLPHLHRQCRSARIGRRRAASRDGLGRSSKVLSGLTWRCCAAPMRIRIRICPLAHRCATPLRRSASPVDADRFSIPSND